MSSWDNCRYQYGFCLLIIPATTLSSTITNLFLGLYLKLLSWSYCLDISQGYPYHTDGVTCLEISADSTLALTGSKDNSVHIVNITTGKV